MIFPDSDIQEILGIHDTDEFADDLTLAGREYGFSLITEYGELMAGCVQTFDVVGVKKKVAEFPSLIERVKSMTG